MRDLKVLRNGEPAAVCITGSGGIAKSTLALKDGFKTSKHEQLIGWFNKTYIKNGIIDNKFGKSVMKLCENRKKGDYDIFSEFSQEMTEHAFTEMKQVIDEIRK